MENEITLLRRTVLTLLYVLAIFYVLILIRLNNQHLFSKQKTDTTAQKTV